MLIIIEGCDCSGKTYLAKKLARDLKISLYRHIDFDQFTRITWQKFIDYVGVIEYALFKTIDWSRNNLVVDRFLYTNIVYPETLGRETRLNLNTLSNNLKNNILVIFMNPGFDVVMKRYKRRHDKFINTEKLIKLHNAFEALHKTRFKEVKKIELKYPYNYNALLRNIKTMLKEAKQCKK